MDNVRKIFSIIFAIGFIFLAIEILTSSGGLNPMIILLFIVIPLLIVIFATLKNRAKKIK
ncbi:MAG: hypothetical protein NT129_00680 [Candidatus Aenigmarchaeota archaeon]|nr:hypothetical protein [Candidatus Aenigmarchaeota archaeon]